MFLAVYPNPPRNLSVEKLQGNKVALKWLEPLNSLFTGYVIKYVDLRFVYFSVVLRSAVGDIFFPATTWRGPSFPPLTITAAEWESHSLNTIFSPLLLQRSNLVDLTTCIHLIFNILFWIWVPLTYMYYKNIAILLKI